MKKIIFLVCLSFALTPALFAKEDPDSSKLLLEQLKAYQLMADSINNAMHYETGVISLPGGLVKLNIPRGFKYLGVEQSKYVIKDVWGNPERNDLLGMIFPENGGPISDSSYAFIISFEDMGYVKDHDADEIDYKEMLEEFHKEEPGMNAQRKSQGYPSIHMVDWAQPPFYDAKNKVLHWAKELKFEGEETNTLNYDVRFLGRRGILSMNAIATMEQLPKVKTDINQILTIPEFTEGNRYADFKDDNTDKIAAYTVGGLVAGKVLMKIGFLAKFWKLILLAVAGIGGFIIKLFKRKKERELVYHSAPPSSTDTNIPS
ncbi:MAG: DUF2167 domain-containing protein [Chitinophagales bacterium]